MTCGTCKHEDVRDAAPCSGCKHGRWWEPKVEQAVLDKLAGDVEPVAWIVIDEMGQPTYCAG